MSILFRWICVLSVFVAVPHPPNQIKGSVVDSEGAAIRNARILVHWDPSGADVGLRTNVGLSSDITVGSDAKGKFATEVPPGFYDVFVTATGFSPYCRKIRVNLGESPTVEVSLSVDPIVTKELGDKLP